jgi:NADPH:quinone reductase-like Zn-dependent oxidoreductase
MMKAVRYSRFGGPEVLEIVDFPDPHPGLSQVRIAVRAAGVNPSDGKKRKGLMGGELPQAMGHKAAGVVDELGESVADVAVGDRVFGFSAEGRPRPSWRFYPTMRRSRRRLTSPAHTFPAIS